MLLKPGSNINVKNASICQDIIFYGLELEFLERSDFGVKYLDISIPVDNRPLALNWGIMKKNERCYLHSNT